jgi:hypothetical protein
MKMEPQMATLSSLSDNSKLFEINCGRSRARTADLLLVSYPGQLFNVSQA